MNHHQRVRAAFDADRRLAILRFLHEDPDYRLNDSLLASALEAIGHGASRDVLRTDLAWLMEQGLVTVEEVMRSLHVATLTERGADVATGRAVVPGVKRPSPKG